MSKSLSTFAMLDYGATLGMVERITSALLTLLAILAVGGHNGPLYMRVNFSDAVSARLSSKGSVTRSVWCLGRARRWVANDDLDWRTRPNRPGQTSSYAGWHRQSEEGALDTARSLFKIGAKSAAPGLRRVMGNERMCLDVEIGPIEHLGRKTTPIAWPAEWRRVHMGKRSWHWAK